MAWLTGYVYRKQIIIEGSTAGIQTNYQMKLTVYKGTGTDSAGVVYLNNHCQDDFDDIRFTKSDGSTELDHWRESYVSATSAIFWIEFDSIPASPDSAVFYIYYSKADAISGTTEGAALSDYADDIEPDHSLLDSYYHSSGSGVIVTSTDYSQSPTHSVKVTATVTAAASYYLMTSAQKALPGLNKIRIRNWYYAVALAGAGCYHHIFAFSTAVSDSWVGPHVYASRDGGNVGWYDGAQNDSGFAVSTGAWHLFELEIDFAASNFDLYVDGVLRIDNGSFAGAMANNANVYLYGGGAYSGSGTTMQVHYYDNYFFRKYCSPEPTWGTWGTEETPPPAGRSFGYIIG